MSNTNEEESLFSELGKFEELQSPFHLFPVLHRELESLNRLKRNREKSVLVSSVLSGLHLGNDSQNQEETLDLSGTRLGNHLRTRKQNSSARNWLQIRWIPQAARNCWVCC